MNQAHEHLKKFFTISVAAFEFQHVISSAFGRRPQPTAMEMLHKMMLSELEKPEPNDEFLDKLLFEMEKLTTRP